MVVKITLKKGAREKSALNLIEDLLHDYRLLDVIKSEDGYRHIIIDTPRNCESLKRYCNLNINNPKCLFLNVDDYIELKIITLVGATRKGVEQQLNESLSVCGVTYKVDPVNADGYLYFKVCIKLDNTFNMAKIEAITHKLRSIHYIGSIKWD